MIPPGWSFLPSDEDILEILAAVKDGKGVGFSPVNFIDVYEAEPWKFAGCYNRDQVGYFYTGRRCIGAGTKNVNRIAGEGKWHGYGHHKDIKSSSGQILGHKITGLSFRTLTKERWPSGFGEWVMLEYLLPRPGFQTHSLCKIYRKPPKQAEPETELQTCRSLKRPRSVDLVDSPPCSAYRTQYSQDCMINYEIPQQESSFLGLPTAASDQQNLQRPGGEDADGEVYQDMDQMFGHNVSFTDSVTAPLVLTPEQLHNPQPEDDSYQQCQDVLKVSQEWDSEAMDDLFVSLD